MERHDDRILGMSPRLLRPTSKAGRRQLHAYPPLASSAKEPAMSVPQPLPVQAHLDAEASDAKELDEDGKVGTDLSRGLDRSIETSERSLNESQERLVAPDQFEERYRTSKYERWAYYSYYIGAFGHTPPYP